MAVEDAAAAEAELPSVLAGLELRRVEARAPPLKDAVVWHVRRARKAAA